MYAEKKENRTFRAQKYNFILGLCAVSVDFC